MTHTNAQTTIAAKSAAQRPRKMAREPKAASDEQSGTTGATPTKRQNKADLVLGLLQSPEGATIDQLVAATGWLPHTILASTSWQSGWAAAASRWPSFLA